MSVNPLIVSSLLLNKCNGQQFTAKYQKDPSSLFFRSPVPTNQMALQWTVTCFSFRGKCTPGISVSPFTPTTSNPNSLHAFHLSEVDPREEITQSSTSEGGKNITHFSQAISSTERVTHSGHLVSVVRIWSWFDGRVLFLRERWKWSALPLTLKSICQNVFIPSW